jgi:GH43 family beta-xylosidase
VSRLDGRRPTALKARIRLSSVALRGAVAALAAGLLLATAGCTAPPARPAASARATDAARAGTFTNPIDESGADPWVIRFEHHYYLSEVQGDSIRIVRSPKDDLTDLDQGTAVVVWRSPAEGADCADVWAPELHHVGTHWYVYFAATTCDKDNANHRMFVLESAGDDPLGAYKDRGAVGGANGRWAIDGTRIAWKGRAYFAWSGWPPNTSDTEQDLYLAEMASPTRLRGKAVRIASPGLEWERRPRGIEEGPEALVHGGVLHIVYSASGSWTDSYCLGMLTLNGGDLTDAKSWTKTAKPVFAGTQDVFGPGHASFTTSPDGTQPWIVYHSARFSGAGWDREIDTQPFRWRSDGSPDFGRPLPPDRPIAVPSGEPS